ncbi:C1q-related factor-like [Protopterus annectens]|uniref:C1q-related factor-like n=1 Tax=Protopterus annectens TaxID=7888 RepID=UPI001CFBC05D|nr:C1q-related factor-like [Protopterus annectens]
MLRMEKAILMYLVLQLCLSWTSNSYCAAQTLTDKAQEKGTFEICSSFASLNPRIAFHACVAGEKVLKPPLDPIAYDNVVLNNADGYNKATGVFTCTIPGVYVFTYSLLPAKDSTDTLLWLKKNGDKVNYIHSISTAGNAQTASLNAVLHLNAGDKVWVQLQQGGSWTGSNSLCFQGYQLFTD